jgi:putative transposase
VLGLWAGTVGSGEGAKFWMSMLTDLRNRDVKDVFFLVCNGLKACPKSWWTVWPKAIVQTCIVHIRDTFRLASKRDWPALKRDLTLDLHRRQRHHHAGRVRRPDRGLGATGTARSFGCGTTPGKSPSEFLDYDVEMRWVPCSTNAIESLNARYRRVVKARGHFPTEQPH